MTSKNTIRALLDEVVRTGRVPDDAEIKQSITKYSSIAELREVTAQVRRACKSIRNALDAGFAGQAREHAEAIGEMYAANTAAGGATPRELAAAIPPAGSAAAMSHQPKPAANRAVVRELRDLLVDRGQRGLSDEDVDGIQLRADLSADQVKTWRQDLRGAASEAARLWASGAMGQARATAEERAIALAGAVHVPEHVDPHADVVGARELAALVKRS